MFTDEDRHMWKIAKSEKLPDGEYQAVLKMASLKDIKGVKKIILNFEISHGDYAGFKQSLFLGLDNPSVMYYTKVSLLKLGVDTSVEIDQLLTAISERYDTPVTLLLTPNGQYQNCKILESLEGTIKNIGKEKEDDIPF